MNHARWRNTTQEERAAAGRKMRLALAIKELGRGDLDPAVREKLILALAPTGNLGRGRCELCQTRVLHLFHDSDVLKVCAVCLGGVER
jgi:hypothetical protein